MKPKRQPCKRSKYDGESCRGTGYIKKGYVAYWKGNEVCQRCFNSLKHHYSKKGNPDWLKEYLRKKK